MDYDFLSRFRGEQESTSVAVPCVVTAFDLSGEPTVSIRPQVKKPYDTFDGTVELEEGLIISEVPYGYPSGMSFAVFVPPEDGMEGLLIVTDTEVGEVAEGEAFTSRRKDPTSGYFIPTGNLTGKPFKGSADWAEMRSTNCRVAISRDTVHLQAGQTSIVCNANSFDVVVGGISLVAALKQMSTHIRALEALVHPNGNTHTGAMARMVDNITALTPPTRAETGVR